MRIKGFAVAPLLKRTGKEMLNDGIPGLAAQTAYYFFFSLFPLFLFLTPLLGVVGDEQETFGFLMQKLASAIPADAFRMVSDVVAQVVFDKDAPGIASVGALLAIWSGSNIFSSLMDALNRAYDVKETRPWWKKKLISISAVLVSGVILVAATLILIAGEDIVDTIGGWAGMDGSSKTLWTILQYPIALTMLIGLAWAQYLILPNLRQNRWHALAGAIATTVLWIIVTLLFRFYVQNFGNYNKTYGTLGGIIVLLTWMYLSMLVLLAGGELASELHKGTGANHARQGAVLNGRIAAGGRGRASTDRGAAVPLHAKSRD
jgi:membrane protein